MLSIFALYALLASSFPFGKAAIDYVSPTIIVGIRMVIAGVMLLGYCTYARMWRPIGRNDWGLFAQAVIFHIFCAYAFEYWAMETMAAGKACLIYSLSPFFTAFIAWALLGEALNKIQWLGLAIGCTGLIPLAVGCSGSPEAASGCIAGISLAEMYMIISVFSASYGWILVKKLAYERSYPVIMVNGIAKLGGGFIAWVVAYGLGERFAIRIPEKIGVLDQLLLAQLGHVWGPIVAASTYIALLVVVANVIFYNLYGYLLKSYSAAYLSFCGFTTPLFAAAIGWLMFGERVDGSFFFTVGAVAMGLYIFYTQERRKSALSVLGL